MTSAPSFLLDQLTVTPLEDGQVSVIVTRPPELFKHFCRFLDALAGYFHDALRLTQLPLSKIPATSQADDLDGNHTLAAFRDRFAYVSDLHTTIRFITADLSAERHPMRSVTGCRRILTRLVVAAVSRWKKNGRPFGVGRFFVFSPKMLPACDGQKQKG